jgi:hypothetical protein
MRAAEAEPGVAADGPTVRPIELIGFAKGQPYAHLDQPDFAGELNKIYLLRAFHRRGLDPLRDLPEAA